MAFLRKMSSLTWLLLVGIMVSGCAEVKQPYPAGPEIENAQQLAVTRHPFKTWNLARTSRVFIKLLLTTPQTQGRTYPFLGFDWWVTETGKAIIDNVWSPSPADDAGLQQGDIILAVNNWPLPLWVRDWESFSDHLRDIIPSLFPGIKLYLRNSPQTIRSLLMLPGELLYSLVLDVRCLRQESEGFYKTGPVCLLIQRGREKTEFTLYPLQLPADYGIVISTGNKINAFAAPGRIVLTQRMIDLCRSDDELAFIIGHELAHQIKCHLARSTGQKVFSASLTGVISFFSGWFISQNLQNWQYYGELDPGELLKDTVYSVYSREDEREADTYGLWYAYQAGYDIDQALNLLERLAAVVNDPFERTYFLDSHPAPLERLARLKKIAQYFKAGRAAEVFLQSPDLGIVPVEVD